MEKTSSSPSPNSLPYLPTEIIINILSRLPIQTIISCKRVCKSWFELVETHEFSKFHLSISVPGLIVHTNGERSGLFSLYEYDDELDLKHHEFPYVSVRKLDLRAVVNPLLNFISLEGLVNGLLFLCSKQEGSHDVLYICNPVTREYIHLSNPDKNFIHPSSAICTYGFGVSKTTQQYKVVIISHGCKSLGLHMGVPKSECRVYTLGTGSWRTVQPDSHYEYSCLSKSIFLNGNMHWLVVESNGSYMISCFDLETELFKAFSLPNSLSGSILLSVEVVALANRLCLCDNTSTSEVVIWIMKEYGMDKSWTKDIVISKLFDYTDFGVWYANLCPIKIFRDDDILLLRSDFNVVYYSSKTKKTKTISNVKICYEAREHVSSFVSLKRFAMENVAKF